MPCTRPLNAYQCPVSGKVHFSPFRGALFIQVPCNQCIACRLNHSRQWATRMVHEAYIGYDFFIKFYEDIVNNDRVVPRGGHSTMPPRYYDKLLSGCDGPTLAAEKLRERHNIRLLNASGRYYGIEAANAWLATFIADFNRRFSRPARLPKDLHRPVQESPDELRDILCLA